MDIKTYWNDRAATDKANATTNDVYLRVLERATLTDHLRRLGCTRDSRVLDAGCGDGETLFALHDAFGCALTGRDYSQAMIDLARARLAVTPGTSINFAVGDVRALDESLAPNHFDFVMTDRCLINLETPEQQFAAIATLAALLRPGGTYLAIENVVEGNDALNALRALYDLPAIAIRWHNLFFRQDDLIAQARKHFRSVEVVDFSSSYYFATRVVYSKLCAVEGTSPDYRHPIHEASTKLPIVGDYSPIKLFVMTR